MILRRAKLANIWMWPRAKAMATSSSKPAQPRDTQDRGFAAIFKWKQACPEIFGQTSLSSGLVRSLANTAVEDEAYMEVRGSSASQA